jgi:hypothetical protein
LAAVYFGNKILLFDKLTVKPKSSESVALAIYRWSLKMGFFYSTLSVQYMPNLSVEPFILTISPVFCCRKTAAGERGIKSEGFDPGSE